MKKLEVELPSVSAWKCSEDLFFLVIHWIRSQFLPPSLGSNHVSYG